MSARLIIATHVLNGRRVGRIANLKTLDDVATIKEAVENGYVVGKPEVVRSQTCGVLKAMLAGLQRDGDGRKIDGYLSIHAFPKGKLADVTDEIVPGSIKVNARARMLKEFKFDPSDWSFIIEGSTGTLTVYVISTGEKAGEIVLGEDVMINGTELAMGEGDTLGWEVPDLSRHGNISASDITSDGTRITVDGDALAQLAGDPAADGKQIVFTLKIGGKKAVKSAVMHTGN